MFIHSVDIRNYRADITDQYRRSRRAVKGSCALWANIKEEDYIESGLGPAHSSSGPARTAGPYLVRLLRAAVRQEMAKVSGTIVCLFQEQRNDWGA